MKTNLISKSETTQLLKIVSEKWKIDLPKVKNLKVYEIDDEIQRLEIKCAELTRKIFTDLSEWQVAQLARHPLRPKSQEIINSIANDFQELHGDRMYSDDASIIGGLGKLGSRKGHEYQRKNGSKFWYAKTRRLQKSSSINEIS